MQGEGGEGRTYNRLHSGEKKQNESERKRKEKKGRRKFVGKTTEQWA